MESSLTLDNLVRMFLEFLEAEKNYSGHTIESYRSDLAGFAAFAYQQRTDRPDAMDREFLRGYIATLFDSGYSRKSIARKIACLRSFFRFLKRKHLVPFNPATNLASPKLEKKLPGFLDEAAMEKLFELPDRATKEGLRDAAILEVFYSTGMRLSELIGMNIADIDRVGRVVKVTGKGRKHRILPIGKNAVEAVEAYLKSRRSSGWRQQGSEAEPVFLARNGKRIYPQMVGMIVRRYLGKVSELEHISPHVLRHTFATHLLNRGADLKAVKELLGHESLSTTQVYTHVTTERLRKVYQLSHPKA